MWVPQLTLRMRAENVTKREVNEQWISVIIVESQQWPTQANHIAIYLHKKTSFVSDTSSVLIQKNDPIQIECTHTKHYNWTKRNQRGNWRGQDASRPPSKLNVKSEPPLSLYLVPFWFSVGCCFPRFPVFSGDLQF